VVRKKSWWNEEKRWLGKRASGMKRRGGKERRDGGMKRRGGME
jgi:hypothetical protein